MPTRPTCTVTRVTGRLPPNWFRETADQFKQYIEENQDEMAQEERWRTILQKNISKSFRDVQEQSRHHQDAQLEVLKALLERQQRDHAEEMRQLLARQEDQQEKRFEELKALVHNHAQPIASPVGASTAPALRAPIGKGKAVASSSIAVAASPLVGAVASARTAPIQTPLPDALTTLSASAEYSSPDLAGGISGRVPTSPGGSNSPERVFVRV